MSDNGVTTEEFVKVALAAVGINEKDDADQSAAERLKDLYFCKSKEK